MRGDVLVAVGASIGNMIHGWDNACIAGAVIYIKKEFNLQNEPAIEGLIVAMSLIGASLSTTCSGAISDALGRRPMLVASSVFYFLGGLLMLWSPNVYIILVGRLLDGFGIGLATTIVSIYISETSPPEIRGSLNTLPQFLSVGGMFLSYCIVFGMSFMESPNWRLMLGDLSIPSLFYFVFTVFYLPESPRWLVSKGRMLEAKHILQRLRGTDDVVDEMALLVEGLGIGETSIDEYIISDHKVVIKEGDKDNLQAPLISRTGSSMVPLAKTTKDSSWSDLFEPGVKHALFVGIGLQFFQQFSGIDGVLYYTPQILEKAGVGVLISNLGISSTSSSILISNITTLMMLPCIVVAMRLIDISGRRTLLLTTIPVLILSLVGLVIGSLANFGSVANAAISTASVIIYFCSFVMGLGPIPSIVCSEIFPTRVRGICIAICALTLWTSDVIVTYSLPMLLTSVGMTGVFSFYAILCVISWVFVFLFVPETKGMSLEVITEFFSVGAKPIVVAKNN